MYVKVCAAGMCACMRAGVHMVWHSSDSPSKAFSRILFCTYSSNLGCQFTRKDLELSYLTSPTSAVLVFSYWRLE